MPSLANIKLSLIFPSYRTAGDLVSIKDETFWFIFLLLILLFTRLYALFSVGNLFFQFEGLYRGYMAKELLEGAGWCSIFNEPYMPAEGGSVVISYLVALFFSIFGDNFFSLALVPILFSLSILAAFYLCLKRYFSCYVAIIFSFLFIFAPPDFFSFSLFAVGSHFETTLFSILGLFCFFEIFFNESNYKAYIEKTASKKLNYLFIILGLISGFGIYFNYSYIIMLFTIIFVWLLIDKRFFLKKHFYIFLAGFIIGFLPWLIYNTTHNFRGLSIHGCSFSRAVLSKSLPQIFQAFTYIVSNKLPQFLGREFYLTIVFSFIVVAFLSFKSFRRLLLFRPHYTPYLKKLFFIVYALIFIVTLSLLYLPAGDGVLPWLSGSTGRLFQLYPFLFVLVALCSDGFIPLKKEKGYLLRLAITFGFLIWVLHIGFLNYSKLLTTPDNKINPLKIKGYSVRLPYQRNQKNTFSFMDRDIYRVTNAAESNYEKLNLYFMGNQDYTIYSNNENFKIDADNSHLNSSQKLYYYLLLGFNTGDFVQDYDILTLNNLVAGKVPEQYLHSFYEGVAISLMNRRRNEIMKNIDFIEKIPVEYRHYFLLELGRVIGSYYDVKSRQEKLQYSIKRFPDIYKSYIHRGLVESLKYEELLKKQQRYDVQRNDLSYLYRAISRHFFGNLPSENDIFNMLRNFKIDKNNERYFYQGIVEAFFKDNNMYQENVVKAKIETVIKCNWTNKDALYEGLGLSLGHLTFGYIKIFTESLGSSLDADQLSRFYYGYCISLKERYGMDSDMMKKLIDSNVTEESKEMCYMIIVNKII